MNLRQLMEERGITIYRLSKMTKIPYATLNDLVHEKTSLLICSSLNVYLIAKALDIKTDELIEMYYLKQQKEREEEWKLFYKNIYKALKHNSPSKMIEEIEKNDRIPHYFNQGKMEEAFYLLALEDYLYAIINKPIDPKYALYRKKKLNNPFDFASPKEKDRVVLRRTLRRSPFQFKRFNLIERKIETVSIKNI